MTLEMSSAGSQTVLDILWRTKDPGINWVKTKETINFECALPLSLLNMREKFGVPAPNKSYQQSAVSNQLMVKSNQFTVGDKLTACDHILLSVGAGF